MQTSNPKFSQSADEIAFIIVAHGDAMDDLRKLFDSLSSTHQSNPAAAFCFLIVQNECSPDTVRLIDQLIGHSNLHIKRLVLDCNRGYGASVNAGVGSLDPQPRWIVICNADLVFPPDALLTLQRCLIDAPADTACVAPMMLDAHPGTHALQPSVGRFPTLASLLLGKLKPRRTRKYIATPRSKTTIDWATGACLAILTGAFNQIDGFDENMFLDYEETDLCKRLNDAGFRSVIEPAWRVVHTKPNAQRPMSIKRHQHTRASLMHYLAKHRPSWELHTMALLLRCTLLIRSSRHPLRDSWRAGLAAYDRIRSRRKA